MERNMLCEISFINFYKKKWEINSIPSKRTILLLLDTNDFKSAYARIHFSRLLFSKVYSWENDTLDVLWYMKEIRWNRDSSEVSPKADKTAVRSIES